MVETKFSQVWTEELKVQAFITRGLKKHVSQMSIRKESKIANSALGLDLMTVGDTFHPLLLKLAEKHSEQLHNLRAVHSLPSPECNACKQCS